jgi:hypothetical protein
MTSERRAQLRNIREHLRTGRFGQREVWEEQLEAAAAEIERLRAALAVTHLFIRDELLASAITSDGRTLLQVVEDGRREDA